MTLKKFSVFLKEGGHAVADVVPIAQENVAGTLDTIFKKVLPALKITKDDIRLLGSTGKKLPGNFSGDIDVAVDVSAIVRNNKITDEKQILPFIAKVMGKFSSSVNAMAGINIVSAAYPIANDDGKQPNAKVQLDLMLVDKESLDFAHWSYHSPHQKDSKYKGFIRNKLVFAIAREMNFEVLETGLNKQGEEIPTKWKKTFMDMKVGLMNGVQTNMSAAGNITKTQRTLSRETITTEPLKVVELLLGPGFTVADTDSFESLYKAINNKNFVYKDKKKAILDHFKKSMLDDGLTLPSEMT